MTKSDEDHTVLAGQLAAHTLQETGDVLVAIQTLVLAAASLCMTKLSPAAFALDAFRGAMTLQHDVMTEVLGAGTVRQ